jgi:alkylhydroperoxidase family enzyme
MSRLVGAQRPGFSLARVVFYFVKRKLGRVVRPLRIHALSPPNLRGYAMMEGAQESAGSVAKGLKTLAQIRVSTRVGCPF